VIDGNYIATFLTVEKDTETSLAPVPIAISMTKGLLMASHLP